MCAADRDGIFITAHDLSQQNGSCYVRNIVFHDSNIFGIVGADRRSEHYQIDVRRDILLLLSDDDVNAVCGKSIRERALRSVRTGDLKASALKYSCQTAHGNPADPRKIDVDRGVEVELNHRPSF